MSIRLKRAYDPPAPEDGRRVLVERLWPRGLTKERAALDLWLKDAAPSPELRSWYAHDERKWPEFRRRYEDELGAREAELEQLRELARAGDVTFVFAARDPEHSSAAILRDVVEGGETGRSA